MRSELNGSLLLVFAAVAPGQGAAGQGTVGQGEPGQRLDGQGPQSRPVFASVSGAVLWKGAVRPPRTISTAADPAYKDLALVDETLLVGPRERLANAVVSLVPLEGQDLSQVPPQQKPIPRESPPADEKPSGAQVTMREGMFRPRVQVLRAGAAFAIENEDSTMVNFHSRSARNPTYNIGMPGPRRRDLGPILAQPELVTIVSDVQPGPIAYVHVVAGGEHRVTGADGAFRFDGLPPGKYRLEVWHETRTGSSDTREVTLAPGKPLKVEVELR